MVLFDCFFVCLFLFVLSPVCLFFPYKKRVFAVLYLHSTNTYKGKVSFQWMQSSSLISCYDNYIVHVCHDTHKEKEEDQITQF